MSQCTVSENPTQLLYCGLKTWCICSSKQQIYNVHIFVAEKCAVDHPHHTLPLLLALFNSYNDSFAPVSPDSYEVIILWLII